MQFGKRRMIILFNLILILSSVMSLFVNWPLMLAARALFSFAAGAIVALTPKVLGETVPSELIDYGFGASTNVFINITIMYTMLLGMGYPDPDDKAKMEATTFWRAFYISPIPIMVVALFMNLFVHK